MPDASRFVGAGAENLCSKPCRSCSSPTPSSWSSAIDFRLLPLPTFWFCSLSLGGKLDTGGNAP